MNRENIIAALAPLAVGVAAATWGVIADIADLGRAAQILGSGVVAGALAYFLRLR
jgi:hypothetical protein